MIRARLFSTPWQRRHTLSIYAPLLPWFLWLGLRFRLGPCRLLRVNPCFPYGGTGLDSKFDRYVLFKETEFAIPTLRLEPASPPDQCSLGDKLTAARISFPAILKPNCGRFSIGVHKIASLLELRRAMGRARCAYMLQPYIDDPQEFAIFYYRLPGEPRGHILDLTERRLPAVTGDGLHTVAYLVAANDDWRALSATVRSNYEGDTQRIPDRGERVSLAVAARGSQGAQFVDSRHLISPVLEGAINAMVGDRDFYFGLIRLERILFGGGQGF